MRKLFFWTTIISGVTAAYLMYRRGESIGNIAQKTVTNPIGSLTSELKSAF